jgi:hypothetical protein
VYWVTQDSDVFHGNAAIHRAPIGGGTAQPISSSAAPPQSTTSVAVDATNVYWLSLDTTDVALFSVAKDCVPPACTPTQIALWKNRGGDGSIDQSQIIALGGGELLILTAQGLWTFPDNLQLRGAGNYPSMALLGDRVAWISSLTPPFSRPVQTAPVDLSTAKLYSAPDGGAKFIASDCLTVFASIFEPRYRVAAMDATKNMWHTIAPRGTPAMGGQQVYAFAADDRYAYVGYAGGGGIDRVDTHAMNSVKTLNDNSWSVLGIALDDNYLYFGDHGYGGTGRGTIYRMRK